jgi:hypothetical protein
MDLHAARSPVLCAQPDNTRMSRPTAGENVALGLGIPCYLANA